MKAQPKFRQHIGGGSRAFKCVLEAYVDSSDSGMMILLLSGNISLLLIEPNSFHTPMKFYSDEIVIEKMQEICDDIVESEVPIYFRTEKVNKLGGQVINKFWLSILIGNFKFLVVDCEEKYFRFMLFNTVESVGLIEADINRNLGGMFVM